MTMMHVGWLPLTILSLLAAGQAEAWSCAFPQDVRPENSENAPTEKEMLRHRSMRLAGLIANGRVDGDAIVVGRFSRNSSTAFLHDQQLEEIRAMYWPPTDDIQMPYRIEYTYLGAYSFEGHKIEGATLVAFSTNVIDARVSIAAEHEGNVDALPSTENDVIGVLRARDRADTFELTTSVCPSYYPIEPVQLSDLLECYGDGSCQ